MKSETATDDIKSSHKINKHNDGGNSSNNNNNYNTNNAKENSDKNESKNNKRILNDFVDVRECLKVTAQNCLVPIFFNLLTTIVTYIFISITNSFDSLRIYCFLLSK